MGRYIVFKACGKTFAVEKPVRVLEAYEFRKVDGKLVNAVHLGDQLADLGVLLGKERTSQSKALLLSEGFGVLVDSADEEHDDENESFRPLPIIVTQQKGFMFLGTVDVDGMKIPVLSKSPNKNLVENLENEKAERVRI